jgi:hypothetical protein
VMLHGQRMSVARTVALIARSTDIDSRSLGRVRLAEEGSVADIPSELVAKLLAASPLDGQVEVSVPDELPGLIDMPQRDRDSRGGGNYGGGSGGGYRGNRQGGGGGRYSNDRNSGGGGGYRGRSDSNAGGSDTGNRDFGSREFVPSNPDRRDRR